MVYIRSELHKKKELPKHSYMVFNILFPSFLYRFRELQSQHFFLEAFKMGKCHASRRKCEKIIVTRTNEQLIKSILL